MMKVLCIFGTRPEAIKMSPVIQELQKFPDRITVKVCVTGQHREMLDQVLEVFDILPDYDLAVMTENQSLSALTATTMLLLEPVIEAEKPDWVLVQGDTTTTMVASLAAFYHRVRIGHVEAGLRTGNKYHPFPEEVNRHIADSICDLHFAATDKARENLVREGVLESSVIVTGNTVVDALLNVSDRHLPSQTINLLRDLNSVSEVSGPGVLATQQARIILVTAHRRENFGEPIQNICDALAQIAERRPNVHIIFLVHLNPNVQKVVRARLSDIGNISLIGPVEYPAMVHLLKRSYLVLTDSGGLQEEAPTFGVPALVMRATTERQEAIEAGVARLVGTRTSDIVANVFQLLDNDSEYHKMARGVNPFGDGHASERIVQALLDFDA